MLIAVGTMPSENHRNSMNLNPTISRSYRRQRYINTTTTTTTTSSIGYRIHNTYIL